MYRPWRSLISCCSRSDCVISSILGNTGCCISRQLLMRDKPVARHWYSVTCRWNCNILPAVSCQNRNCHHSANGLHAQLIELSNRTRVYIGTNDTTEEIVKVLEREKCELFEILEWPQILQFKCEEIEKRILYLKEKNMPVSVGHLKCVSGLEQHALFRRHLKNYHKRTGGYKSVGECLIERFGLSKDSVIRILTKVPSPYVIVKKISLLTEYGYEVDKILSDPKVLKISEQVLHQRCEDMSSVGIIPPIRKYLVMSKASFKARIASLLNVKNRQIENDCKTVPSQTRHDHSSCTTSQMLKDLNIEVNDTVKANLKLLEEESCEPYEIIEWPQLLYLETKDIKEMIMYLGGRNIPISVGHMKTIYDTDRTKSLGKHFERYHKNTHGHKSIGDCLILELGYNKNRATQLLTEYPDIPWPKFVLLRKFNIEEDAILRSPHMLTRCSKKELSFRCRYLLSKGLGPISILDIWGGKSRAEFLSMVKEKMSIHTEVADLLNISVSRLNDEARWLPADTKSVSSLQYLIIERKYPADEILNNLEVVKLNVNELQSALTDLESVLTKRPIPLDTVVSYSLQPDEKIPVQSGISYAKTLLITTVNVDSFVRERVRKITNVSTKDIQLNYHYLLNECKLNQRDIGTLPIILLHDPVGLRLNWNKLVEETEPGVLTKLYENPERLLHLLQYYMERSTDFRHIYVLKNDS